MVPTFMENDFSDPEFWSCLFVAPSSYLEVSCEIFWTSLEGSNRELPIASNFALPAQIAALSAISTYWNRKLQIANRVIRIAGSKRRVTLTILGT